MKTFLSSYWQGVKNMLLIIRWMLLLAAGAVIIGLPIILCGICKSSWFLLTYFLIVPILLTEEVWRD